ncbi:hypothetical protein D3C86_2064230 [compost metagenome]
MSRALASATSAAVNPTSPMASATGATAGLNQVVSRSATRSRINGWLAYQFSRVLPKIMRGLSRRSSVPLKITTREADNG